MCRCTTTTAVSLECNGSLDVEVHFDECNNLSTIHMNRGPLCSEVSRKRPCRLNAHVDFLSRSSGCFAPLSTGSHVLHCEDSPSAACWHLCSLKRQCNGLIRASGGLIFEFVIFPCFTHRSVDFSVVSAGRDPWTPSSSVFSSHHLYRPADTHLAAHFFFVDPFPP